MSPPQIVRTTIHHARTVPVRHTFTYRSYSWLVDLDAVPTFPYLLRPLAGFHAADHVGDPHRTLRENVDSYLGEHGIDLSGGRIRMLANARVFGFVFNPLTLYWCHDADGTLVCAIAEVHNTYGGRHRYLLPADQLGQMTVPKAFYVSPFNPVSGRYVLRVPEPARDRLRVAITLLDPSGGVVLAATWTGSIHPARPATVLATALAAPLAPLLVAARIRWQGVRLWARGLPLHPRPQEAAV
ncbi:DUF1365 domain-containing protein [Mycolicibacterium sp. CBMA 226]|uniref:DUF1365 domain-containing protein n=1 Tax=Mycolicibacterium sp. CBMA 226 TaxID=2606611 RepID=UPI0012DF96B9|nr:DUF1365 domain-containing protein [Mycolicibacterium sp. CBMA 226]MUL76900.1 DUF1365 domain-containing protein [Mycolicibacterium sp. CBMA 226]